MKKLLKQMKAKDKLFDIYSDMLDEYAKNPSEKLKKKIEIVSCVL